MREEENVRMTRRTRPTLGWNIADQRMRVYILGSPAGCTRKFRLGDWQGGLAWVSSLGLLLG